MWGSIQVLPNQVREKSFDTFKDIDLREFHAKLNKKPSETLGVDSIQRLEMNIYCLPRSFSRCSLYFAKSSFAEMKRSFIELQNEP